MFQFRHIGRRVYPQKHILVCEDNIEYQQKILAHLSELFTPDGAVQVSVVPGAHAASCLLSYKKIDLIILDHDMPEGNGMDLIEWLQGTQNETPVLIFSDEAKHIQDMNATGAALISTKDNVCNGAADGWIRAIIHENAGAAAPTRPKVTVLLSSGRPGGIDISLRGLADQTYDDFEVVFVDGLYHRRHARVLEEVQKVGFKKPFFHVPHHRSPDNDIWGVPSAGYNTGFMLAAGEIVIMLLDYAYAPPGWIEAHLKHHIGKPRLVMGPHNYVHVPIVMSRHNEKVQAFNYEMDANLEAIIHQRSLFDDISIFETPFHPDTLPTLTPYTTGNDYKRIEATGPSIWASMHTKNDSFPTETILEINGMDEFYDRGRGPGDTDLGRRLYKAGLQPWLSAEAQVTCLNPRTFIPNANVAIPRSHRLPPPHDKRFCYDEGVWYYQRCENIGSTQAPNPYSLKLKRERIWHWRELSQQVDPVIPDIRISDKDWFHDL